MIHVTIIDDVSAEIDTLKSYLKQYSQEKDEQFEVVSFTNPVELLNNNMKTLELVFLDIEMPSIDGVELAKTIRKNNSECVIIFVTNMAQYAIKGYEVEALGFIIKPIKYPSFELKLNKAIALVKRMQKNQVVIKTNYEKVYLNVVDILYVEVREHLLIYHTSSQSYEVWGSMSKLAKEMENDGFALCNASFLLNLHYVTKISNESVYLNDLEFHISKTKRKSFLDALTKHMG